jgi:hypothetical protein
MEKTHLSLAANSFKVKSMNISIIFHSCSVVISTCRMYLRATEHGITEYKNILTSTSGEV